MGGLARKATVIEESRNNSKNLLILDSGDLLFAKNKLIPGPDNLDGAKIRAKIIIESFNEMGCDAFSPGSKDFALGLSYIQKIKEISNFDYISCNLYNSETSNRLFNQYKIVEIDGSKIALVGATSTFYVDSVLVKEPISEIVNTINDISNKSDFVILLFNATDSDLNRLQATDVHLDLILRSKGSRLSRVSEHAGREKFSTYSSGNKGKYLNKIDISRIDRNRDFVDISLEENNIKLSNTRLNNKKKSDSNADLEKIYKDNQNVLNDILKHKNKIKESQLKIKNAINTLTSKKIPLSAKVASKPDILMIVDKGMAKIPNGPPLEKDTQGRLPGDPHHGHNH